MTDYRWQRTQAMGLTLITPPAGPPLSLTEVKNHLRIESDDDSQDDTLMAMVGAVRSQVEDLECWIQLITATYELRMDCFPPNCAPIIIPRPPLQSVGSIKYVDTDGNLRTFGSSPITEYAVDTKSVHTPTRGEIHLAHGESWPAARREHNAVRVQFTCGFSEPEGGSPEQPAPDLPDGIRQWMLMRIGSMYENRESEVIDSGQRINLGFVDALLDPFRVRSVY